MSNSSSRRNSFSNPNSSSSHVETHNTEHQKINDNNHVNSNLMNFPDCKWIEIFINGDEYFTGCRCVINNRYYRNIDMFLNYLTERLKPSFGAVRNIYTPINGHPVYKLEDLMSKHKYVVAGNERFKKLEFGYSDVNVKNKKRFGLKPKSKFKVSKAKSSHHSSLSINFHQNGIFKVKPNKVNFLPQDLENLELVFRKIRESTKCGPIKRICSLIGKPVQYVEELINNQTYIVIGKHEIFKPGQYGLPSQKNNLSSKGKNFSQRERSSRISSVVISRPSSIYSHTSAQSSKQNLESTKKIDTNLQPPAYNCLNITELGNGVDSLDSFKPGSELHSNDNIKIKIDLDDDLSGIFRSKTQNHLTAGAAEIEDSPETVVDLPVDLVDAEEVDDEVTPDMERSLQHLSLDVPEEIVAYLPAVHNSSKSGQNSGDTQVTNNKYNLSHSQTLDVQNIFA